MRRAPRCCTSRRSRSCRCSAPYGRAWSSCTTSCCSSCVVPGPGTQRSNQGSSRDQSQRGYHHVLLARLQRQNRLFKECLSQITTKALLTLLIYMSLFETPLCPLGQQHCTVKFNSHGRCLCSAITEKVSNQMSLRWFLTRCHWDSFYPADATETVFYLLSLDSLSLSWKIFVPALLRVKSLT